MAKKIYHRQTGKYYTEEQFGDNALRLLYNTGWGRVLLNAVVSRRWFSRLAAIPQRSRRSARKIPEFVARYGIDMSEYKTAEYGSFGEFFTRTIRPESRPVSAEAGAFISPADAKLTACRIDSDMTLTIKDMPYTLRALLGREGVRFAEEYEGGICLVLRLTVDDYHRFCYADSGRVTHSWETPGRLYTVGPYSDGNTAVYAENHRFGARLETVQFGPVVELDVGALLVGRVEIHPAEEFERGQERGFFAYGGSSIVLLVAPGRLQVDEDILEMSRAGTETKVRMGEKIGQVIVNS